MITRTRAIIGLSLSGFDGGGADAESGEAKKRDQEFAHETISKRKQ
jgi:hypothetical protein